VVSGAVVVAQGLFAALFPSNCRLCGAPLENISRLPVCRSCLLAMAPISGETCDVCGDTLGLIQNWDAPLLADVATSGDLPARECLSCQEQKPYFAKAVAYGSYDGGLRELVHLLKYDRVEPAAGKLGSMLCEAISKLNLGTDPFLVVPVPLHISKRHERGFNQAEMIARKALRCAHFNNLELGSGILERARPTASQIGLTRPQRAENLRGAFRVAHLSRVKGRDILLVDDVLTTGTTASECARVLLKAGARKVLVATVARTLKHQSEALPAGLAKAARA
jgi:ComF family protein